MSAEQHSQPAGEEINARKGEDFYGHQFASHQMGTNALLSHFHTTLTQERQHSNRLNQIAEQALQNAVSNSQVVLSNASTDSHAMNAQARNAQAIMTDQYTTTSPWEARGEAMAARQQTAADVNVADRQATAAELAAAMKPVLVAAVSEGVAAAMRRANE